MSEKHEYVEPTVESYPISMTEGTGSGACVGSIPPELCGDVAPTMESEPMGS